MMIVEAERQGFDVEVYYKIFPDGRRELSCFYGSDPHGWAPMVAVWEIDPTDPATVNEDQISIAGKTFAYCVSDQTAEEFDDLVPIEPKLASEWVIEMMVAGIIFEQHR